MVKLPAPECKKVGSTNLLRIFIEKNYDNFALRAFNELNNGFKTLELKCSDKRHPHTYSLSDFNCKSCNGNKFHIEFDLVSNSQDSLGTPRIVCDSKGCGVTYADPHDFGAICEQHKEPQKTSYFLIGNNNNELEFLMLLAAANQDSAAWHTTQYMKAFNGEDSAAKSLDYLVHEGVLKKPNSFEANALDIPPLNRKPNLYQITKKGTENLENELEKIGLLKTMRDFASYRESSISEFTETYAVQKSYSVFRSIEAEPSEEENIETRVKHVPNGNLANSWEKDCKEFWGWLER